MNAPSNQRISSRARVYSPSPRRAAPPLLLLEECPIFQRLYIFVLPNLLRNRVRAFIPANVDDKNQRKLSWEQN